MFPFWDLAIAPVLEAVKPRSVVEIGSLRGDTTTRLLEWLGPEAELHVIDPLPEFDPAAHERRFAGRYVFHRDLSLNVLPRLPAMDVALIDGDHNWYTVYTELKLLAAHEPLPVLVMHDVCWPYGRRDLYYDPDRIPAEHRHPFARKGIKPGRSELVAKGGLNPELHNAVIEGGPRNGVATALDDFLTEHGRPVRRVTLPVHFGLAIVAEEVRLASEPKLSAALDRLEGVEGQRDLVALADRLATEATVAHHSVLFPRRDAAERSVRRYLDLLAAALLDEHYLENELRNHYLAACARKGLTPNPSRLRDPGTFMRVEMDRLKAARRSGRLPQDGNDRHPYFPYTTMGRARLDHLQCCLDTVRAERVAGDLVECGTGRGGGAIFMRGYLDARGVTDRTVWVADTFRAAVDQPGHRFHPLTADLNAVREGFERFRLLDERVRFLQGPPGDTLREAPLGEVALVRIGDGLVGSPAAALDAVYDRLAAGAFVIAEDYGTPGRRAAIDALRERRGIVERIERVDAGCVCWRKTAPGSRPVSTPAARPSVTTQLSVVVVFYDMRREAERTLHSLSRAYQEGIEDLEYEVIAVENGSPPGRELGEEFVRAFGLQFRYLNLGPEAPASPAPALNRGIAAARGEHIALMIDGAHLLTPGVLRYGMEGLRTHAPAVVATQQWYLGPGQQHEQVHAGYDEEYEDGLLANIGWPSRGYDLFGIGHFIGDRDWLDGMPESNCLFAPRSLLEQTGGLDESFTVAGGGFANLDLFERLAASPGVTPVTILGEGSFHQVHGGTTTNTADPVERRRWIAAYRREYATRRGRDLRRVPKDFRYVGHMPRAAARTRARRRVAPTLFRIGADADLDGIPERPSPIPDDLKQEYAGALWSSLGWEETSWLGRPARRAAADLVAFQELIARLRPAWIVETCAPERSLATFFASICDLLDRGRVLSIGDGATPAHPRVERVAPADAIPAVSDALVVLGSRAPVAQMLKEFDDYSPLVPGGGYLVVEDTILNGHPVWPSFGPGPAEAVTAILRDRSDFTPDLALERYGPTFNPRGWLRRVAG